MLFDILKRAEDMLKRVYLKQGINKQEPWRSSTGLWEKSYTGTE